VSEIMAPTAATSEGQSKTEAELAVEEALQIFATLKNSLKSCGTTVSDVMFVHVYLSEISHFATINAHYQECFGSLLPPSRSCVAVGPGVLPGGRRVLLDCMIQKGSGEYMRGSDSSPLTVAARATLTSKLREVLHVQSISNWAPVCVGPYSQSNTLRSSLHFLAGQIGLVPATMQLHPTWSSQLQQCWRNTASVLDALNGASLDLLFSGLIYVVPDVYQKPGALDEIESITTKQLGDNGSVVPGRVDSNRPDLYGGYEDEATMHEMEGVKTTAQCPILVVAISEMPKNAAIEVEVVTVTKDVASSLEMNDFQSTQKCRTNSKDDCIPRWDTGHEFPESSQSQNQSITIDAVAKVVGHGCAASVLVLASTGTSVDGIELQPALLLSDMFSALDRLLAKARAGLLPHSAIHVRLYYLSRFSSGDGVQWRTSLQSAVASWDNKKGLYAATTVVPVQGISLINSTAVSNESSPFLAMQVLFIDPVHMETEQLVFDVSRDEFL
jgi:enamine deaminase RidA (YjgF/YER057c/UK114 family)